MRETPRAYATRTGRPYAPDPALVGLGDAASEDHAVPTLFRYPGPLALLAAMDGRRIHLAPGPLVTLGEAPDLGEPVAARRFGALAVLDPLALGVVATETPGVWRGWSRAPVAAVWVPPSAFHAPLPWDAWFADEEVRNGIAGYTEALLDHRADLSAYVEELSGLARSGHPGPSVPWLEVPDPERRERLSAAGLAPRWTR